MLQEYRDYMTAEVYKFPLGDCGGISDVVKNVTIFKENTKLEDIVELHKQTDMPLCKMFVVTDCNGYKRAEHVQELLEHKCVMCGGNYAYTSDSRFKDIAGIKYPVSLHDRCES